MSNENYFEPPESTEATTVKGREYPYGGYAPGNYWVKCRGCRKTFVGDKRAWHCEPCAEKYMDIFLSSKDITPAPQLGETPQKVLPVSNGEILNMHLRGASLPSDIRFAILSAMNEFASRSVLEWQKGEWEEYEAPAAQPMEANLNDPETTDERTYKKLSEWYQKQLRECQEENKRLKQPVDTPAPGKDESDMWHPQDYSGRNAPKEAVPSQQEEISPELLDVILKGFNSTDLLEKMGFSYKAWKNGALFMYHHDQEQTNLLKLELAGANSVIEKYQKQQTYYQEQIKALQSQIGGALLPLVRRAFPFIKEFQDDNVHDPGVGLQYDEELDAVYKEMKALLNKYPSGSQIS